MAAAIESVSNSNGDVTAATAAATAVVTEVWLQQQIREGSKRIDVQQQLQRYSSNRNVKTATETTVVKVLRDVTVAKAAATTVVTTTWLQQQKQQL